MKTSTHLKGDQQRRRPAAEADRATNQERDALFIDNRLAAVSQHNMGEAIHSSPHMVAQRKQLCGLFGAAAQFKGGPEDEELLQGKFESVQRVGKEELLQGKFAVAPIQCKPDVSLTLNKTGLPDNLKSGIESLSGLSMDHVKVHYNSSQPAQLNALAYTQGADIHVAPGQERHLPHEAWHVVQQAQGRVLPTMQMQQGISVNDDAGLEHEADVMGAKAAQMMREGKARPESISSQGVDNGISSSPVQRAEIPEDILDHQEELENVLDDIETIQGPHGKTDEALEDTIAGAENWASETRYAAKRKYVEYDRASEAYARGASDILLGEDTTTQSDIEYQEGNRWVWEESKLVSGSWPQFGVNVLAAREQLAGRTEQGGRGVASIQLTKDFYEKAYNELGYDENTVELRCTEYLTKTMRKKFPSAKGTHFIVKLISYKGSQAEYDVTKWHR